MADFNPELWRQAWHALPMEKLMAALGHPGAHEKKAACPFCDDKKGKWYVRRRGDRTYFHCYSPDCVANDPAAGGDEIGFLALKKGLPRKEAAREYLHLALPESVISEYSCDPKTMHAPPVRKPASAAATAETVNVWHGLWKRLSLRPADRSILKDKRGFSDETIEALGFRSNHEGNLEPLHALAEEFGREKVVEEGIFKADGRYRPAGQLYGYGITGKQVDGRPEFAITEPIIIPYLDEEGIPFYLRPHKGGVKKPRGEEDEDLADEDERPCDSHVYCPFTAAELIDENDGLCVLTEGEFKVGALYQCHIPALAAPGISFMANPAFKRELIQLLEKLKVTSLVIIYDNEEKGDPKLPNYKEDPWKRYDTLVWAEFALRELRDYFIRINGSIRLGWLPDEHRIEGKADFDGILAAQVKAHGQEKGTRAARKVFLETIRKAREEEDTPLDLFPAFAQRIIANKLARLRYKPKICAGGDRERKLGARFYEVDPTHTKPEPVDAELAALFKATVGCYYERKAVRDKEERKELDKRLGTIIESISERQAMDHTPENAQKIYFLQSHKAAIFERLKGLPKPISDFTLTCDYKLHGGDGTVDRLVRIKDSRSLRGPTELRRLKPKQVARAAEFKEWIYGTGLGTWKGGQTILDNLAEDLNHHAFQRDIFEITRFGHDPDSKLWFFGDCAFAAGAEIQPDESGIFWHEGIGYRIEVGTDEKGAAFSQGVPMLRAPSGDEPCEDEELRHYLGLSESDDTPLLAAMFRTFASDLFDTIGDYDGFLALGMTVAYLVAPELMRLSGHPGLWVFGRMSGGKSTVISWLQRLWGFKDLNGTRLDDTTTTNAICRVLAQYSSLPVFFDEYRHASITSEKEGVLRGAFDRSAGAKALADYSNRTRLSTLNTTPIVGGEASSSDAATRSRYAHILVAANRRLGDGAARYDRICKYIPHLHRLGHWLLQNQPAVSKLFLKLFTGEGSANEKPFLSAPHVKKAIPNERIRFVHGASYCAFQALTNLLEIGAFPASPECTGVAEEKRQPRTLIGFQTWLLNHANQALHDVQEETFMSQFWGDLIAEISRGKIHTHWFEDRYVQLDPDTGVHKVCRSSVREDEETGARTYAQNTYEVGEPLYPRHVLFIAFREVFAELQEQKRKRGLPENLTLHGIRREMEKEAYFITYPKGGNRVHNMKFGDQEKAGRSLSCWAIDLDRRPLWVVRGDQREPGPHLFPFTTDILAARERPAPNGDGS